MMFYGPVVVRDGWLWFVCPLGVMPLTYWQAFGLITLVGVLRSAHTNGANETPDAKIHREPVSFVLSSCTTLAMAHLIMWAAS